MSSTCNRAATQHVCSALHSYSLMKLCNWQSHISASVLSQYGRVLQADSEGYNPADDSDCDAPKKSSSKRKTASSKSKKGRWAAVDRDTESDDHDAPAANSAQVGKAAAAALRSIKSTINAQMVYKPSIKCKFQNQCLTRHVDASDRLKPLVMHPLCLVDTVPSMLTMPNSHCIPETHSTF